jgi:membrane associated rhomboid family serine protease
MLGLNAAVFAFHLLLLFRAEPTVSSLLFGTGSEVAEQLIRRFGGMTPVWVLVDREYWRLLSACFVHFGVIHFGMNMMALLYLSRLAEPAIGSIRFLIAYVMSGIAGFAASLGWSIVMWQQTRQDVVLVVKTAGASGAIFGVMGVVLGFLWRRGDPRWKEWLLRVVVISVLITFALGAVNHAAHLAGLVAGAVFGAIFAPGAPSPSRGWQRVIAWLAVAACVGSVAASLLAPPPRRPGRTADHNLPSEENPAYRRIDTFMSSATDKRIVVTLEPPYENSGNVMPTTGSMPLAMPRLMMVCQKMSAPQPTATTAPKRSRASEAMRTAHKTRKA